MILEMGGRKTGSVSGKTNYLIVGYKLEDGREVTQGGKYRNATKHGTTILDEEGFEKLIRDKSGVQEFELGSRREILMHLGGADESSTMLPQLRKSLTIGEDGEQLKSTVMWTDLYRPNSIMDLVGNEGAINQLFEWLRDWEDVVINGNKKEVAVRFTRNWQDIPRINAKAAMISGAPGIGKTSACRIICQHLGYKVLEMNASDCRSKLTINASVGTLS